MYFYHYFDRSIGPFRNLSDLTVSEAEAVLARIRQTWPGSMCAARQESYINDRLYYEEILRREFVRMGGRPERKAPHYMVVGDCPWLHTWYENCDWIRIPAEEFDCRSLSFTYGDSHPTFSPRVNDGREYRKKLYDWQGIQQIMEKYGLPQEWNPDGKFGPERYVEVHVWSDEIVARYRYLYDKKDEE